MRFDIRKRAKMRLRAAAGLLPQTPLGKLTALTPYS